jgi:chromosome segregation ATPase
VERAHVGTAGTGALISGTGQEMALKARLNRLRESVQREATRLEFLRQERAREESRNRTSGGGGAMAREQERQLDNKIRREEERLATIQRKIELTEVEEEKRRERIADLERRITELRADIAELERERSDARHKTEIAQVEMKSAEDAVERKRRMAE